MSCSGALLLSLPNKLEDAFERGDEIRKLQVRDTYKYSQLFLLSVYRIKCAKTISQYRISQIQRVGRNARGASIDGNGLFGFLNSRRLGLGFASSAGGQVSTAERSAKHTEG